MKCTVFSPSMQWSQKTKVGVILSKISLKKHPCSFFIYLIFSTVFNLRVSFFHLYSFMFLNQIFLSCSLGSGYENGVWICMLEKQGYCLWWTTMHNAAFSVSSTFIHTHTEIHTITCMGKQGYKSLPFSFTASVTLSFKTQSHINTFQIAHMYLIANTKQCTNKRYMTFTRNNKQCKYPSCQIVCTDRV